jgi:hypothetical protein
MEVLGGPVLIHEERSPWPGHGLSHPVSSQIRKNFFYFFFKKKIKKPQINKIIICTFPRVIPTSASVYRMRKLAARDKLVDIDRFWTACQSWLSEYGGPAQL